MFKHIENIDREITIFINNLSINYLDNLMIVISNKYVWIPLYIFLIYWLWKFDPKNFKFNIILCIASVIISDHITSSFMKPFFVSLLSFLA